VNLVFKLMNFLLVRFGSIFDVFQKGNKIKLVGLIRFNSNILIGLQHFFLFWDVLCAIIFSITCNIWCIQLSPYTVHKRKDMIWFSNTYFNSNKTDNNKLIGFQIQNRVQSIEFWSKSINFEIQSLFKVFLWDRGLRVLCF
jgi:hypothetical protein